MNFQECTNDSIFHLQFPKADLCRDVLKEQMHLWRLLQQRTQTIYIYKYTYHVYIYIYVYIIHLKAKLDLKDFKIMLPKKRSSANRFCSNLERI